MSEQFDRQAADRTAAEWRYIITDMICRAGSGHIGGALSLVEILYSLYNRIMNVDPSNPKAIQLPQGIAVQDDDTARTPLDDEHQILSPDLRRDLGTRCGILFSARLNVRQRPAELTRRFPKKGDEGAGLRFIELAREGGHLGIGKTLQDGPHQGFVLLAGEGGGNERGRIPAVTPLAVAFGTEPLVARDGVELALGRV